MEIVQQSERKSASLTAPADTGATKDQLAKQLAALVGAMTSTQQRRVNRYLSGESLRQIAKAEGRSLTTVAESLRATAVRNAISFAGCFVLTVSSEDKETELLGALLNQLAKIALKATRPVVLNRSDGSQDIEYVPDYRVRIDAASRLIALADIPRPHGGQQESVERSITATERRTKYRTSPVR